MTLSSGLIPSVGFPIGSASASGYVLLLAPFPTPPPPPHLSEISLFVLSFPLPRLSRGLRFSAESSPYFPDVLYPPTHLLLPIPPMLSQHMRNAMSPLLPWNFTLCLLLFLIFPLPPAFPYSLLRINSSLWKPLFRRFFTVTLFSILIPLRPFRPLLIPPSPLKKFFRCFLCCSPRHLPLLTPATWFVSTNDCPFLPQGPSQFSRLFLSTVPVPLFACPRVYDDRRTLTPPAPSPQGDASTPDVSVLPFLSSWCAFFAIWFSAPLLA